MKYYYDYYRGAELAAGCRGGRGAAFWSVWLPEPGLCASRWGAGAASQQEIPPGKAFHLFIFNAHTGSDGTEADPAARQPRAAVTPSPLSASGARGHGSAATTTPGTHRGVPGFPTLALAARCMPGAVVPAAFRGPRAARRPLLTGAGHHQQAEGRRPPPAPPPRQERHGDEQEGEEQQDGGGAAQRGKRRLHGAAAGGASRPTAAGAAQNSALGGRAGPGTAPNGRARPLSLSYTLSYTLRNSRAIPIHLLQFYTLPWVLFLLKLVKYVNWQLSEAATIKALPQQGLPPQWVTCLWTAWQKTPRYLIITDIWKQQGF